MRNLFTLCVFALLTLAVGCTTQSSGGGSAPGPRNNGNQGGPRQEGPGNGRTGTTAWQCAVQFESGIVACGTYTSAASDQELQQHCLEIPGQPVQTCPVNNFQLTCLIRVEGADIRFRMAGTSEQRAEMTQICRQNNGEIQN